MVAGLGVQQTAPKSRGLRPSLPLNISSSIVQQTAPKSRGLRPSQQGHQFGHGGPTDSPEIKGIKTADDPCGFDEAGRPTDSPEIKGIKTIGDHIEAQISVQQTAPKSRGLRQVEKFL